MTSIMELCERTDGEIRALINAIDIPKMSPHNLGVHRYAANPLFHFVQTEKRRYIKVYSLIRERVPRGGAIFDVGCFIPYLPVMLALSGYAVTIVDNYSLYSEATKAAVEKLTSRHSIRLLDLDILSDNLGNRREYDAVLLMAVVEHLNGSPKRILEEMRRVLKETGLLFFEVPNIAEFTKRLRLLFGRSNLSSYEDYYWSEYPYLGHNREMTVEEVRYMMECAGFAIQLLECYDYSLARPQSIKGKISLFLKAMLPISNKGSAIMAMARVTGKDF